MTAHIQTHSGLMVDPLHLSIQDIRLEDIAHALSNLCRFTGHTSRFYSVAEHSVLVSYLTPPPFKRWALLHDASEAYLQDIPTPLKALPEFAFYREAERRAQGQVARRFKIPVSHIGTEREADRDTLHFEADRLLDAEWADGGAVEQCERVLGAKLNMLGWAPRTAEQKFLDRAAELGIE